MFFFVIRHGFRTVGHLSINSEYGEIMNSPKDVMKMMNDNDCKFVDLRFTDTRGKEQHVSVPASAFEESKFEDGHPFDGSSIAGWKGIQASDMLLIPDPSTAVMDPFREEQTLLLTCDVIEPSDGKGYDRDPRSLALRAEAYMQSTGIGDQAFLDRNLNFCIRQRNVEYQYGRKFLQN